MGALRLEIGRPELAIDLLAGVAAEHDTAEAWAALASAHDALGAGGPALRALERALHASVVTPALAELAERLTRRFAAPGWCGLDGSGAVRAAPPTEPSVGARSIGSPLPLDRLRATAGLVAARRGGLGGWAWHAADPGRDPVLTLRGPAGSVTLQAAEPAEGIAGLPPLARPRRFTLSAADVRALGEPVSVLGDDGRHLLGSPLRPGQERRERPVPVDGPRGVPAARVDERRVDVVVPVYRGARETVDCIGSVLASVPAGTVVHVVDDGSDEPELVDAMDRLAGSGAIRLIRWEQNRGFPAAANAGMRASAGRDVVLLNSDTLVAPGWLERLRRAAYSASDVGSATPLSNDATIVSYRAPGGGSAVPDRERVEALDRLAQRANGGRVADLPVGVGFCLYLRRDCLDQVGAFRDDVFAQGYGEENDWCLRARQAGWRHVAALDVFVGHVGGRSFGGAGAHLRRRNGTILNRLHPGYDALVAAHVAADPLRAARRRMDALQWARGRSHRGAVILITHAEGGGVEEVLTARCAALLAEGRRPIVLRPDESGCRVEGAPNLRYAVPGELRTLAALLRPDRPALIEVHHMLGHDHRVLDLARLLDVPVETWVHDYAAFCPRIALVGRERRYCGEPEVAVCEACVAELGAATSEAIPVRSVLARSTAELVGSRRVVAPSQDAARRLARHFPAVRPDVVAPEDDAALPPLDPAPAEEVTRICVVGAVGVEKGYDVLLGCVRDARRRALPLAFVVCGYTEDDGRLLAAGDVFITGRYRPDEAVALVRAHRAQLAFLPSVWPETWCLALSRAWQAGLPAVAFDLGAQAERIRATGRGHLLPLGLPVSAVNDALLRLAPPAAGRQCPQPLRAAPPRSGPQCPTPPRPAEPQGS